MTNVVTTGERVANAAYGVAGLGAFLAIWEIGGRSGLLGDSFPPISEVIALLTDPDRRSLFERAVGATFNSAIRGFGLGAMAAVLLASIGALTPMAREGLDRFVASVHAVPLIALGPLFIVLLSRDGTPAAIAGLAAFFPVYVATSSGFDDTSRTHRDVFSALGANRRIRMRLLQLPAALPSIADGLRLAAPAAVLGSILGEWFGAPRGIGILIVSSMQNFQITQLWASAFLAAAISLSAFGLFGLLERFVVARVR